MARKAHGNKKQPRLFAYVEGVTRDGFLLCGGPDVDDAIEGLNKIIYGTVDSAIRNGVRLVPKIQLRVERMTDGELELLDMG
jgi:hypothetical protein